MGNLIAGRFRIPIGIQVKRHRNNAQRSDIDRFVDALPGRFAQGLFLTISDYAPAALQKAAASIPCVLTLNGDQVVSIMFERQLGIKRSSFHANQLDIDPDYFAMFEAMRGLLVRRVKERSQPYSIAPLSDEGISEEQAVDL